MKEYTLLSVFSVLATLLADRLTGVRILKRRTYYIFMAIIAGFFLLVNGYLTGRGLVLYSERFCLGVRVGSIPVEDMLFGFSMVTMTIMLWEYFKSRESGGNSGG